MKHNKIYIVGIMGSGKTTLAKKLSEKLKIKHYSLDDIYHIRKFDKKRSSKARENKLNTTLSKKSWIIEGVHNKWTEDIFRKEELVIWLDLNPTYLIINLIKRFFKKEDEKANLENTKNALKYAVNYRKDSKKFKFHSEMIKKHKPNLIHIRSNKQINQFLKSLK
jgi:adenylate kinase family enzyme